MIDSRFISIQSFCKIVVGRDAADVIPVAMDLEPEDESYLVRTIYPVPVITLQKQQLVRHVIFNIFHIDEPPSWHPVSKSFSL